ncbi:MAG: hypothetical protein WA776_09525 [Xanthobacteraceae bacterium]
MPAAEPSPVANDISSSNDSFDSNALARELMMPTGEPVAAVIGGCLLLGMIWLVGAFGVAGGAKATHAATAPRPSLQSNGGPVQPPSASSAAG